MILKYFLNMTNDKFYFFAQGLGHLGILYFQTSDWM